MPPLPAGISPAPLAPAPAGRRRSLPRLLFVFCAVLAGVLGGTRALPLDPDDFLLFALGMFLGMNLQVLATLLYGRLSGLATVWLSVGVGRWLGSTVRGGRLVTFRSLPLILVNACMVVVARPGLRRRMWCGAVLTVLTELLVAALLVAAGGPVAYLGWGVAVLAVLTSTVRPGRATTQAWRLFRLPFGQEEQRLAEWLHDPASLAAARAAAAGRVDLLRAALDGAEPSDAPRRQAMTAVLALAEGRCADAARTAAALRERSQAPTLRTGALQLYACAIADGIAAGHWRAEEAMPTFSAALAALRAEAPAAAVRGTDLAAMEALFAGRAGQAERLAAQAASVAPDVLSRARALLTQSAAHTVAGHPALAPAPLARAQALSPTLRVRR